MNYIIQTNNLTKKYGDVNVVESLNMHVPFDKIYGLVGKNGAGKSTIMRMVLNLTKQTSGDIKLFDIDIKEYQNVLYSSIGSMIESPGFYGNLTGRENLNILRILHGIKDKNRVDKVLQTVGLENEANKKFSNYSLGMKQRLGIAASIIHNPKLLILDEPINGLDPMGIKSVRKYLKKLSKEQGITILLSSHILSEMQQLVDVVGIIDEGKLKEEISVSNLQEKCRLYIEFKVSDLNKALEILKSNLNQNSFEIKNNYLRVYDKTLESSQMNKILIQNNILVSEIKTVKESFEEYFSNKIGDLKNE